MPSKCKGCDAPIIWFETPQGKRQPFDAKPMKRGQVNIWPNEDENWTPIVHMIDTYMPHHATCPEVERFR